MIFAAPGDTGYDLVLLVHILSAFVAFAPAFFVHPALGWMSRGEGSTYRRQLLTWSMIVTGVLGFALAGMSDDVYSVSDGWVVASIIVWIAMNGVLHAVLLPAEKAWGAGDNSAEQKLVNASSVVTLLMVGMMYLMVFKPGA
jgi:uncharacterized membrane protein